MKQLKTLIAALLLVGVTAPSLHADDNVYFKGELSSGNVWTDFANMGIAAIINNQTGRYTFNSILNFGGVRSTSDNMSGFGIRDLFSLYGAGIKIGYASDRFGFFNYAPYGSVHYNVNCFDIETVTSTNYHYTAYANTIHSAQLGAGINLLFGSVENKVRFNVDAGLRYNLPFIYKGELANGVSGLNSGVHYVIGGTLVSGPSLLSKFGMSIGIIVEFTPTRTFKDTKLFDSSRYKYFSIGWVCTLCPWGK